MRQDEKSRADRLAWFANLKTGDKVCLVLDYERAVIATVTGAGKQFLTVRGGRYNRNGKHRNEGWHSSHLVPLDSEEARTLLTQRTLRQSQQRAMAIKWGSLPIDVIKAVLLLVPKSAGGDAPS